MSGNHCVVCYNKNIKIYSIGECDHAVCYECSTRMRVLCSQTECPICRYNMSLVVFAEKILPFNSLKKKYWSCNEEYKIAFVNSYVEDMFKYLLVQVCNKCYDHPVFDTFEFLKNHMEYNHNLFCCDLCTQHLKIFPKEQRWYTHSDLARHKRTGDPDDRSRRGHPLCKFCDLRFLDNDELYRHLRRTHHFCHICDAEGVQGFYRTYGSLREHFKTDHYLCEEGDCLHEQFTSVFSSEFELNVHRALKHSKNSGKKGDKFAHLQLQITYSQRPRSDRHATNDEVNNEERSQNERHQARQPPSWLNEGSHLEQAFPALGSGPAIPIVRPKIIRNTKNKLAITDENFPALSTEASTSLSSTSYVATISSNNNNSSVPTASISYASSSVRINQKPQKKRVVNSLHINPSTNVPDVIASASNSNNTNSNQAPTNSATNFCSKVKSNSLLSDKNRSSENAKGGRSATNSSNSSSSSNAKVHKEEFPTLINSTQKSNKQNKKSSVTVHIEPNTNTATNGNIAKEGKNKKNKTSESNNCEINLNNQKKVKMKPVNEQNSNNAANNATTMTTSAKTNALKSNVGYSPVTNDTNSQPSSLPNSSNSEVASSTKCKKKCSLIALVSNEDDERGNFFVNLHNHSRKQKNHNSNNSNCNSASSSKQNKQSKSESDNKLAANSNNNSNKSTANCSSRPASSELSKSNNIKNIVNNKTTENSSSKGLTESASKLKNGELQQPTKGGKKSKSNANEVNKSNENKKKNKNDGGSNGAGKVSDEKKSEKYCNSDRISNSSNTNSGIADNSDKENNSNAGNSRTIGDSKDSKVKQNVLAASSSSSGGLSAPPPGFTNVRGNSLTFTNSQGQSFPMNNTIESTQQQSNMLLAVYKPPPNFVLRNMELLGKIPSALIVPDEAHLSEFKKASLLFRDNYITAIAYYMYCKNSIKDTMFDVIFVDLVILLPDIYKQQELWGIYQSDRVSEATASSSQISICSKCFQILAKPDLRIHLLEHEL